MDGLQARQSLCVRKLVGKGRGVEDVVEREKGKTVVLEGGGTRGSECQGLREGSQWA